MLLRLRLDAADPMELEFRTLGDRVPATAEDLGRHFGLDPATLCVVFGVVSLERVGGSFVLPSSVGPGGQYDFLVYGHPVFEAKDGGCPAAPSEASSGSPHKAHPDYRYQHRAMQERYEFLANGLEPKRLRHQFCSSRARANWKKNVRRRFSLREADSRLMAYKQKPDKYMAMGRGVYSRTHPLRLVLFDDAEAEALVRERHERGHDRQNRMRAVLSQTEYYKHSGLCAVIDRVLSACNVCAESCTHIKAPTMAIMTTRPHELVMFDLFFFAIRD